jgi:hypothetical protein
MALIFRFGVAFAILWVSVGCSEQDWIELKTTGEQDKPLPIILVSSKKLEQSKEVDRQLLLKPERYVDFRRYVETYACRKDIGKERLKFGAFALTSVQHNSSRLLCAFNRIETCNFSSDTTIQFPELTQSFTELRLVLGCRVEDIEPEQQ